MDRHLIRVACAALVLVAAACTSSTNDSAPTTTASTTTVPKTQPLSPGGAKAALDIVRRRLGGPLLVRRVVLYPEYLSVDAQDPRQPENLDSYTVRDGTLAGEPDPIRLTGSEKDLRDLWAAESVDWDAIADVAQRGGTVLGFEGTTSYVVVDRDSSSGAIEATGYVSGPRRSGRWTASATGQVVDTVVD